MIWWWAASRSFLPLCYEPLNSRSTRVDFVILIVRGVWKVKSRQPYALQPCARTVQDMFVKAKFEMVDVSVQLNRFMALD